MPAATITLTLISFELLRDLRFFLSILICQLLFLYEGLCLHSLSLYISQRISCLFPNLKSRNLIPRVRMLTLNILGTGTKEQLAYLSWLFVGPILFLYRVHHPTGPFCYKLKTNPRLFSLRVVTYFYMLNDSGLMLATELIRRTRPIIFRSMSSRDLPCVSGT